MPAALNQFGRLGRARRMPTFALDVGSFRLSFAEGAAILLVRHDAVATRVSALLRFSHNVPPELFDRGTAKAFQFL
jgi:hypothetical protein